MLKRFWLMFAQACTLCLAALFVVATLRPDLLPRVGGNGNNVVLLQQAAAPVTTPRVGSYADAAKKAMPAVVNIYTSKAVRTRNPLLDDSILQRYFPELLPVLCAILPERCVVDGEIIIANAEGLDFDSLQLRLHPAESRVRKLAGEIPASYVAFDLLALGDTDLCREPFAHRRQLLEQELSGVAAATATVPVSASGST